jgi:hypothetical protein
MIIRMTTRSGRQRSYDHRLRDLVQRTGDLTIATDLGVPRSTARGWLGAAPRVVVSLETADLTEPELRQEILKLRRRVEKLAALLRLALALLRASGFSLATARLPEGEAKLRILSAIDGARGCVLWVSNSSSGGDWQLNEVPAVGHPTHMAQIGRGHRLSTAEAHRRVALQ